METKDLIPKIKEIENLLPIDSEKWNNYICQSFFITAIQFVRSYIGKDTEFYINLESSYKYNTSNAERERAWIAKKVLKALTDYLTLNLEVTKTEKYTLRIGIISDFMEQSITLANDK